MPRGCPVGSPGMAFLPQPSPFFQTLPQEPSSSHHAAPPCPQAEGQDPAPCSPLPCCPSTHTPIRSPQPGKGQRGNNSVSRKKSKETFSRTYSPSSLPPAGTAGPTGAPVHPTVCSYTFRGTWSCLGEQLTFFFQPSVPQAGEQAVPTEVSHPWHSTGQDAGQGTLLLALLQPAQHH